MDICVIGGWHSFCEQAAGQIIAAKHQEREACVMNGENQVHQIIDWVRAIADIARRHGLNDFPEETDTSSPTASAHLCGLTVFYRGRDVMRIKTHDMDVRMCHEYSTTPDTSDISFLHPQSRHADFHSGSPDHLAIWHARLLQLSSFFAGSQTQPLGNSIAHAA